MNMKKLTNCPFNPGHQNIEEEKLEKHFQKCPEKAKNEHLFAQCIHNKLHWVKKELLEYHLKGCLDKPEMKNLQLSAIKAHVNEQKGDGKTKKRDRKGKKNGNANESSSSRNVCEQQTQEIKSNFEETKETKEPNQVELDWAEMYNTVKKSQARIPDLVRNVISNTQDMNAINTSFNNFYGRRNVQEREQTRIRRDDSETERSELSALHYGTQKANESSLSEESKGDTLSDISLGANVIELAKPKIFESSICISNGQNERIVSQANGINLEFEQPTRRVPTQGNKPPGKNEQEFMNNKSHQQSSKFANTKNAREMTQTIEEEKSGNQKSYNNSESLKASSSKIVKGNETQSRGYQADESRTQQEDTANKTKSRTTQPMYFGDEDHNDDL